MLKTISLSDSQLVGKVGKGGWPFCDKRCQLQEEQERGRCLLRFSACLLFSCTRKLSAIFQEDSLSPNLPLSLCLSATSLPLCMLCHQPPSTLLSLSAAVKSERLQVCFLSEGRFTAAVRPRLRSHDIAPLPIYQAVIYPWTQNIHKQHLHMRVSWLSDLS